MVVNKMNVIIFYNNVINVLKDLISCINYDNITMFI